MWWGASLRSQGLRDSIPLGGGGTLKPSSSPGPPINRYIIFFDLFFWVTGGVVFFSFWRAFSLQKWANNRQKCVDKGLAWANLGEKSILQHYWQLLGCRFVFVFLGGHPVRPPVGPQFQPGLWDGGFRVSASSLFRSSLIVFSASGLDRRSTQRVAQIGLTILPSTDEELALVGPNSPQSAAELG